MLDFYFVRKYTQNDGQLKKQRDKPPAFAGSWRCDTVASTNHAHTRIFRYGTRAAHEHRELGRPDDIEVSVADRQTDSVV